MFNRLNNNPNIIISNLDGTIDDIDPFPKEEINANMTLNKTNEKNELDFSKNFLNNKTKRETNHNSKIKHTKYSYDNLKRECKHLVIENVMKFINNKIYDVYNGNIGEGLNLKKLMKLNQKQKINADVEYNKLFLKKSLKEIFSHNITSKIVIYQADHNKKVINEILLEKKNEFEKLFELTFIQCVEHFIGKKQIEELNGLTLFSELKENIIEKYEDDGETYYENLKIFLKEFEYKINRAKSRKKRIKVYKKE